MDTDLREQFELQAQIIQALAHPIRIAIVDRLRNGEVCVCDLAAHLGAERSNVSRHLAVMLRAGVVRARKEGLLVFYSLRTPCILNFLSCATQAARQRVKEDARALA